MERSVAVRRIDIRSASFFRTVGFTNGPLVEAKCTSPFLGLLGETNGPLVEARCIFLGPLVEDQGPIVRRPMSVRPPFLGPLGFEDRKVLYVRDRCDFQAPFFSGTETLHSVTFPPFPLPAVSRNAYVRQL